MGSRSAGAIAFCDIAARLCELMNADGSMMCGDALVEFSRGHGYPMLTIDELVAFLGSAELVEVELA